MVKNELNYRLYVQNIYDTEVGGDNSSLKFDISQ